MSLKEELAALYEEDFFEWTRRNSELLRRGCLSEADIEHIAEEIRDMGERDKREVHSRLIVLIIHLLKWQFQPERRYSESGSSSWTATINEQRRELELIFESSGSLKRFGRSTLPRAYRSALEDASVETGIPQDRFPADCPYSFEEVTSGFFPCV